MAYSFECGSCHAIYKLDENQITAKGVKITCPRCMSYFILKKGLKPDSQTTSASIEYVMDDGISEVKAPEPKEQPLHYIDAKTTKSVPPKPSKSKFDSGAKTQKIHTIPKSHIRKPVLSARKKSRVESTAAPYPTAKKKKNKAVPYLLVAFIIIAAIVLLYWKVL